MDSDGKAGQSRRRVGFQDPEDDGEGEELARSSSGISLEAQEAFMGLKARRRSSINRLVKGDYINVGANEAVMRLLFKHGDKEVLFADHVVKINRKVKITRRVLVVTNAAVYLLDAEFFGLRRRVPLLGIGKLFLSELNDNFFAIMIPSEFDTLLASTRKTEIVTALGEAIKKVSGGKMLEVNFGNRFQYVVDAETAVELEFEETEGGVKTKFTTNVPR